MAVHTRFLKLALVPFHTRNVLVFVAFETQLAPLLYQQPFLVRLMRVVTGRAFIIANGIVLKGCFGQALLEILMALEAKLAIRFAQQFLLVGCVGPVAGGTFPILDWLMFHFCRGELLLDGVVAFETKFPVRFQQQTLGIRRVRVVATEAFAILDRLMFRFGGLGKWIMAQGAKVLPCLQNHFRIQVPMGIMARGAFAVFGGLMLHFEL